MPPTAWTPALNAFEAAVDKLEAALDGDEPWEDLELTAQLPSLDDVEPSAAEFARFEDLRLRATTAMARLQQQMQQVQAEQRSGETKIAAARAYQRGF